MAIKYKAIDAWNEARKEERESVIDRVLEIIDKETDYIDSKYVYDEEITYQEYARHFTSIIRAIKALKGGEGCSDI